MISKELLSLVLGITIDELNPIVIEDNELRYIEDYDIDYTQGSWKHLNLDTLGRLCKKWCIHQRRHLRTQSFHNLNHKLKDSDEAMKYIEGEDLTILYQCQVNHYTGHDLWVCSDKTELEAIIKATTWVAKNKELL